MSRGTFLEIYAAVKDKMDRQSTQMRSPVHSEKRLAAALWYLANGCVYRLVSTQFGIGVSTIHGIVMEVCEALESHLFSKVVCLGDDIGKILDGFGKLGVLHTIAALDGSHIPICAPGGRTEEFCNWKQFCSVILQGTVDHTGRFINAEFGFSGRTHNAFVFTNSNLYHSMDAGIFVPANPKVTLGNVSIPALVLADGAYPLRPWLMTPFRTPRGAIQKHYNRKHAMARNVVERAFGRLKARWRVLQSRLNAQYDSVFSIVTACVILHNIFDNRPREQGEQPGRPQQEEHEDPEGDGDPDREGPQVAVEEQEVSAFTRRMDAMERRMHQFEREQRAMRALLNELGVCVGE
ncbi:uncharacterized protein LOC132570120 [Heteronotia binoei]|uniref:uncharacterized protein LOC132570120 n=1 Tax=Heteronotia binoei TaxID=13085 RepID=UPI00292CBC63|nr:uncharacterized protein LOC132570120 [Heteronotia binoei]